MLQRFRNLVRGSLRDHKSAADASAALMMGAVDQAGAAAEPMQQRTGQTVRRMDLVFLKKSVPVGRRKVLDQIAAEIDIDKLHSPADAKDWFPGQEKGMQESKLDPVQRLVRRNRSLVFLAEPGRMKITAAGQQKFVIGRQLCRIQIGFRRNMAKREDSFVISGIFRNTGD